MYKSGFLKKKGRNKSGGFAFASFTWKNREIIVEGRTLKYQDEKGFIKGLFRLDWDLTISRVSPSEADNKQNAFQISSGVDM